VLFFCGHRALLSFPTRRSSDLGYFMDEGLFVELEAQANWKVLLDRVIDGQLDGAHMLAAQPLAATIGVGTQADVITAFSMDLNRSEEHTSELQSRENLVCRLLL